jgi:hypothetical protein
MNDGNQSKVRDMINFDKLRMMANRVEDIAQLSEARYRFESNPVIANYISVPPDGGKNLGILKAWSVECEPKNG